MSANQLPQLPFGSFPCGDFVLPEILFLPPIDIPPPPGISQLLQSMGLCFVATGSGSGGLQASLSASPTSGTAPLTVNFSAYATGGVPPYTYDFYFGDGNSTGSSSLPSASHTYVAGNYNAYLAVIDSANNTATTRSIAIAVSSSPSPSTSTTCSNNSQCPSGYVCVNGQCVQETVTPFPQIEVSIQVQRSQNDFD